MTGANHLQTNHCVPCMTTSATRTTRVDWTRSREAVAKPRAPLAVPVGVAGDWWIMTQLPVNQKLSRSWPVIER